MQTYSMTRSKFCSTFLQLRDQKYGYDQRIFLPAILDSPRHKQVLQTGRQVSKSTTDAGVMLADSAGIPHFQSTLVMPTQQQTQRFSRLRLKPFISDSPRFKSLWWDNSCTDQVFNKTFKNGSVINMGSAFQSADSMRGISSDRLLLDEIQDLLTESVRVLEETVSASPHRYYLYTGTPKTTSHAIESYWRASTQNVWAVRCGCGFWNMPLGMGNLSKAGLCCTHCGSQIDAQAGQWVVTYPDAEWEGWHISQLMCPWIPWSEIWSKYQGPNAMHIATFVNEVLGFAHDLGQSPVAEEEVMACCDPPYSLADHVRNRPAKMFGGLDWALQSPDMSMAPSFTILTILGMHDDRLKVFEVKKYTGWESDPDFQVQDIVKRCNKWGVEFLGCDWGVGHRENQRLRSLLNDTPGNWRSDRLIEFRYTSQTKKVDWDPKRNSFGLNRTRVLEDVFETVKRKGYHFPKWEETVEYARDILAVFTDVGSSKWTRETRYDHPPEKPDDWLHSLSYASLACWLYWNKIKPH